MGAIKDIISLFTQFSSVIVKIQASLQAWEKENAATAAEIAELKKKILELEKNYSASGIKRAAAQAESLAKKTPDMQQAAEEEPSETPDKHPATRWQNIYKFFEEKFSATKEKPPDKGVYINEELIAARIKTAAKKAPDESIFVNEELIAAQKKAAKEKTPAEKAPDKEVFVDEKLIAARAKTAAEAPPDKTVLFGDKPSVPPEKAAAEKLTDKQEAVEEKQLAPKEKTTAEILQEKYEFSSQFGIYKSRESGGYFCPACLKKNIESPLTEKLTGWQCEAKECGEFYLKPGYKTAKSKEGGRRPFQW